MTERDQYGGWTGKTFEATGFLRADHDGEVWRIRHMRTRDCRRFGPNPHDPIFTLSPHPEAWDCDGVLTPQVIEIGNAYYMVYAGMRDNEWQTGLAKAALRQSLCSATSPSPRPQVQDQGHR